MRYRGATWLDVVVAIVVLVAAFITLLILAPMILPHRGRHSLQASCGSCERQVIYAVLAYANDWKDQLPTRSTEQDPWLFCTSRLPIMGFDTTTGWTHDWQASPIGPTAAEKPAVPPGVGGLAYVMRDYLKNDSYCAYCPAGWVDEQNAVVKDCFYPMAIGYDWLPHRQDRAGQCVGNLCTADRDRDTARLVSDRPELLLITDFSWRLPQQGDRLAMNHYGPGRLPPQLTPEGRPAGDVSDWPPYSTPDYQCGPPAGNVGRLDARTIWRTGADVSASRYVVEGTILMW